MWTIIEVGIGMVAGSIATFRPLLRKLNITGLGSSDQQSGGPNQGLAGQSSSYYKPQELGYIKHKLNAQSAEVTATLGQDNDSQEMIWEQDQNIHKRVDVSVSRTK